MKRIKNQIFDKKNSSLIILLILSFVLLFLARILATPHETREHAAGSARLYFTPDSSSSAPIQQTVDGTFTLEVTIDPASEKVSFVRFDVLFDETKVNISGDGSVTINSQTFPVTLEGPVFTPGKVAASVSIGNDPTKAITATTQVARITFRAIENTSGPIQITFDEPTQALSIDSDSGADENVLGVKTPAFISIDGTTPTSTVGPTSPIPSNTPQPSVNPSITNNPTRTPTMTIDPSKTTLVLNLLLHGIGSGGDSSNPSGSDFSNQNPIHQERKLNIQIVNEDNQVVATKLTTAFFNSSTGTFDSHVVVNDPIPQGDYIVKVKTDPYLRKLMPGFLTVEPGKKNEMKSTGLVTGDINGDNAINILDYNLLYDCGYGQIDPLPMINNKSKYNSTICKNHDRREYTDLNDNGTVNSADYNLFIRELSVGFGQ